MQYFDVTHLLFALKVMTSFSFLLPHSPFPSALSLETGSHYIARGGFPIT